MIKRFVFPLMLLLCLGACTNDNDLKDIEAQIRQAEEENARLKKEAEEKKRQAEEQERENEEKRRQAEEQEKYNNRPVLLSVEFLSEDNPMQLVRDATCEVVGDSIVECWVANMMSSKVLVPRFEIRGESITIDGKRAESGASAFDFSKPVTFTVTNLNQSVSYTVYVHSYTGLPVAWIETEGRADIRELNWNYDADFKLVEDVRTRAPGDVISEDVAIKVLPPVTYYQSKVYDTYQIGKNHYVLTFDHQISLLDEPQNNDWELRPNKGDKSLIRTQLGLHLGYISQLDFTPKFHFVEMMLNGRYYGTYMLGDRIESSSNRVNVGLDGYILKIDSVETGLHFSLPTVEQPISVLSPITKNGESEYVFLRNYLDDFENALFSTAFNTPVGWQMYIDADSFVDWYLINEIAKNESAAFKSDCYIHFKKGEKMKMGPLWSFEQAFGNGADSSTSGFVVNQSKWFARLLEDPSFVKLVKERYTYFYNHRRDIITELKADAEYLRYAAIENNNKWNLFDVTGQQAQSQYQKEIQALENWLSNRMDWLNTAISNL